MTKTIEVNVDNFESEVINSDIPVLVDFWAPWCGPCRMIAPSLDQLAQDFSGRAKIAKLNIDQNQELAVKYHVRSIPMLLVFKNGTVDGMQIGAVGLEALSTLVEKSL